MTQPESTPLLAEEGISSARASICNVLRSLIRNNIEHFKSDTGNCSLRFHEAFVKLQRNLNETEPITERLRRIVHEFDYDAKTPGNGYRSFISVVDSCVLQCIRLSRYICLKRSSFLFRTGNYCYEVEAYAEMMGSLRVDMGHLEILYSWSSDGNLYPYDRHSADELLMAAEKVNQEAFYGRCLGFQFCDSMRKPLLAISILMASFSEVYYNTGGGMLARTASSLLNCGRYVLSPEERARRVVDIAKRASVDFCKAFWLLQETEVMQLNEAEQKAGTHFHIEPASPGLIIHVHGGGFVAQSSKSHEVYLRDWARQLNVPILSIDYSLAPLAPYPRALEEILYVYAWALKNVFRLGTTGENIILMGDSAGGNLIFGIAMKTIELGIRKPDGIFAMYAPLNLDFVPSPSRLLCLMDPLLPFGFMLRCLKAYAGDKIATESDSADELTLTKEIPIEQEINFNQEISQVETCSSSPILKAINELEMSGGSEWKAENVEPLVCVDEQSSEGTNESLGGKSSASLLQAISLSSEDGFKSADEDFVSEFVNQYGKDNSKGEPTQEDAESEENILFEREIGDMTGINLTGKLSTVTDRVVKGISSLLPTTKSSPTSSINGNLEEKRVLDQYPYGAEEFKKFQVAKDPYLSPLIASDEVLKKMPRISFLSLSLDPCLDDSIMLCKRLRSLGASPNLIILDKLPHGFLSFCLVSRDAYEGSRVCVRELQRMLALEVESD
uniref:Hormone-sensitive lipase n=1 Tax=Strigamia maritima TaxID=126957 RepID=T1J9H7_STRMM